MHCPLCLHSSVNLFTQACGKAYWICQRCEMVFLDPQYLLDADEEKKRYLTHQNDQINAGYRKHFEKLLGPLCERLSKNAEGLDYGSGPFPALQAIMREKGFRVQIYDVYFSPEQEVLKSQYDFVTCVEVAEHLYRPAEVFDQMIALLKTGGVLGVMTQFYPSSIDKFINWYYHRDPTHVCFYNRQTFQYLARQYQLNLEFPAENIALLSKN